MLIDCGVSCRCLKAVVDLSTLEAVLITHNHTDHTNGLETLLNKVNVPVYANAMTADSVISQHHLDGGAFVCFENGQDFDIGPFSIHPFSVPHDAADPVGYLIGVGNETYFHGTDIGTPLDAIGLQLALADVATLESNHDSVLLNQSPRPVSLKQRIAGPRGHLSNDDAADLVRRFASPRLRKIFLAHLSHECNEPHLALGTMQEALREMGRLDIELTAI